MRTVIALALVGALGCKGDAPAPLAGSAPPVAVLPAESPGDAATADDPLYAAFHCLIATAIDEAKGSGWQARGLREGLQLWRRGDLPASKTRFVVLGLASAVFHSDELRASPVILSQAAVGLAESGNPSTAKLLAEHVLALPSQPPGALDTWHRDALMILAWARDVEPARKLAAGDADAVAAVAIGVARSGDAAQARALIAPLRPRAPSMPLAEAHAWLGDAAAMHRELARFPLDDRTQLAPYAEAILARTPPPAAPEPTDPLHVAVARHELGKALELLPGYRAAQLAERTAQLDPIELELWIQLAQWSYAGDTLPARLRALTCH